MVIQNRLLPEILSKFVLFLGTFVHLCWQAEKTTFVGGVAVAPSLFFVFGFLGLFFVHFKFWVWQLQNALMVCIWVKFGNGAKREFKGS